MTTPLALDSAGYQFHGARVAQNDSYATNRVAAFVADGVGDGDGARETADAAVSFYCALGQGSVTVDDLLNAPREFATARLRQPGATTIAGVILEGDHLWFIAHGDSSFLHVRDGELLARSTPHNSAGVSAALDLAASPIAAHSLTRMLSSHPVGESDIRVSRAGLGDTVVLCTDGFAALLSTAEMVALAAGPERASDALDGLLAAAARHTADDNATCVVLKVQVRTTTNMDGGALA